MHLHHPSRTLEGKVILPRSKSISNRLLIIRSLSPGKFSIENLSDADDTRILQELLNSSDNMLDAGMAGSTLRFLMARLSLQEGEQVLTGAPRLRERPIAPLVNALRELGADIRYLEKEDRLPVAIGSPRPWKDRVSISAHTSSQFISALLMIAPALPNGLRLELQGFIASRPYIEMTLILMGRCGITWNWEGPVITVPPQKYDPPSSISVEPDWSAAAFFYEMAALAQDAELEFPDLESDSLQGDAKLIELFQPLGVSTKITDWGVVIKKVDGTQMREINVDFSQHPDLAQAACITCAGLGILGTFSGMDSLSLKETDRIKALRRELKKIQIDLYPMPVMSGFGPHSLPQAGGQVYRLEGKPFFGENTIAFQTYNDHRMAMCLAPLALLHDIELDRPEVVSKSFPGFWKEVEKLGFQNLDK